MDARGKRLREALDKKRRGKSRWRCPTNLRAEVVGYVEHRRVAGDTYSSIAEDLGLSASCLERWCRMSSGPFREVHVSNPVASSGGLSLMTPRGYRLEGLSLGQAVEMLRDL